MRLPAIDAPGEGATLSAVLLGASQARTQDEPIPVVSEGDVVLDYIVRSPGVTELEECVRRLTRAALLLCPDFVCCLTDAKALRHVAFA